MIIKNIHLHNFRNYEDLKIEFDDKINIFYGDNGIGKTNLLEAIYYLSIARSFKKAQDNSLLKINQKEFFLEGNVYLDSMIKEIKIYYDSNHKKILINDKIINKLSQLAKNLKIIYFYPLEVNLLKESPLERRNFLNYSISQIELSYFDSLIKYNYYLKERNKELKKENPNLILLDVYLTKMIELSKEIYLKRKEYLEKISFHLNYVYQKITSRNDELKIEYKAFIDDLNDYFKKAKEIFKSSLNDDLLKKYTTKGIHHEDFAIKMNNKNVAIFGSQGENRIAVLSLKLAAFYLFKDTKDKPIIILDDVLSELDKTKQDSFLELLEEFGQVFITNTSKISKNNYKNYFIEEIIKQKEAHYD